MATKEALANARELVDLDVKEVSLVDHPANLRPFLVVKRMEGNTMGVFETDYTGGGEPSQTGLVVKNDETAEGDPPEPTTDITKALSADQQKAIGDTIAWVSKLSKGPGAPTVAIGTATELLQNLAKQGAPHAAKTSTQKNTSGGTSVSNTNQVETADVMQARHAYETAVSKGAGEKATESLEDMTKRHEAELAKAGFGKPDGEQEHPPKGKKAATTKAADEVADAVVIKADGSVHVSGDAVNIAKAKGFTAARTEALKGAVGTLVGLLGDVDEKAVKEAFAGLDAGRFPNLPIKPGFDSQVRPTGTTGVAKAADGGEASITDVITAAVTKAVEPLQEQLEAIEKTRQPSQSGGDPPAQTEVKKSLFDGIL